jgi:hypothetical protein
VAKDLMFGIYSGKTGFTTKALRHKGSGRHERFKVWVTGLFSFVSWCLCGKKAIELSNYDA